MDAYLPHNTTLKSAVDMAIFDIAAKVHDMPLYAFLGGQKRTMETDLTMGIGNPDEAATAILTAASLSFLGLGAQPPTPEWGAMLSDGRAYLAIAPHVATIPGLAILITVLAFNLLGDGLRDALDPKLEPR